MENERKDKVIEVASEMTAGLFDGIKDRLDDGEAYAALAIIASGILATVIHDLSEGDSGKAKNWAELVSHTVVKSLENAWPTPSKVLLRMEILEKTP